MLQYLRANFDLTEILEFGFNVRTNVLTVQGRDVNGRVVQVQKQLDRRTASLLFRLNLDRLMGLE